MLEQSVFAALGEKSPNYRNVGEVITAYIGNSVIAQYRPGNSIVNLTNAPSLPIWLPQNSNLPDCRFVTFDDWVPSYFIAG